jgi:hypothetical protein
MSNHVNYTIYNILQGHHTSLVEWPWQKHSHTHKEYTKTITIHEDTLLFISNSMSVDEYKYWKAST